MSAPATTLEREREHERLEAALDAAAAGAGRTIVIEGPPGIGKTRLLSDVRAAGKARGFERLQATGDELESAMAWSVVRELIERPIARYASDVREQMLGGASGAALALLDGTHPDAPAGDAAVSRTLHALWWVAADLASSRPVLVTVDDAQWADLPSLRFLSYLSRRIDDLAIALVIATRPPRGRSGPLAELSAGRGAARIVPRPLSPRGVAALGARGGIEPADGVVAALHAASGGNPFLANVLIDELQDRGMRLDDDASATAAAGLGPSTISRALLGRLPPDASKLAGAAAVLGAHSDPSLAAAIAGLDRARLPAALDALVAGHVLASREPDVTFVHPVVREAVLGEVGPGERAALHANAARALHRAGAPAARVAAHLVAAPVGTLPAAASVLRCAAVELLADGDAATAAAHLARALREQPADEELRAELGFALLRAREPARAAEHLRAAAAAAPGAHERAQRLAGAASARSLLDGPGAAVAELRAVLDAWPDTAPAGAGLVLEARLAEICSLLPDESRRSAERLQRFADLPGRTPEERTLLAILAQRMRYDVCPASDVAPLVRRALGDGAYLDDVADAAGMVGWAVAVIALISAEAIEAATAEIARGRASVREHGTPAEFGIVSLVAGWLAWRTGDVAAAEAEAEAAVAAVAAEDARPEVTAVRASATHVGIFAALERGHHAAAAASLEAVEALCAGGPRVIPVMGLGEARAILALGCDEPARAYQAAMALGDETRSRELDTPTLPWRTAAALAALRLGDEDEARALAAEQHELARRWGTATDTGAALRLLARIDARRRLDLLGEAIAVLDGSPARMELARALVDHGEALRVARRRQAARHDLRRAADLAAGCGSRVLRQRALDALAALGDRPRKLMFSGEESLTASERRVARLASEGRSNRDIAQELFVTPKTVENHLGRVYIKLGISSRKQLAVGIA